ncbi:MAG: type VI secretion system tube protein Hcp [Pseudomonadota bacterium]
MALDMFLIIDKGAIEGESQDDEHTNTIDLLAWSWGISQSGSFHMGGGGGAGKANFQDISITKYIDKSSSELMLYCSNGDHFDTAELIVRKAGKNPLEYLTILMNDVLVTSVSTGGSGGEDRLTENVTLNFAGFEVAYTPQKKDGTGDKPKELKWWINKNKAK